MKVDTRAVLIQIVEAGISYGMRRAYKHTDTPSKDAIESEIDTAIWQGIDEMFNFEDEYHDS